MATTWIAEAKVVFVMPDGTRSPGRIAVAQPVPDDGAWRCEVSLDGYLRTFGILGEDSLQALLLGAQFLGTQLHALRDKGGRVLVPPSRNDTDEEEDCALEAYFGPMLIAPKLPPA